MHRIPPPSNPSPAPLKSGIPEGLDQTSIHVASCPQRICLRIQINRNPPAMRRQLRPGPLRTKHETPAKTPDLRCQTRRRDMPEDVRENSRQPVMTAKRRHRLRMIPGKCQREGQRNQCQRLRLPPRIQTTIRLYKFPHIPKLAHNPRQPDRRLQTQLWNLQPCVHFCNHDCLQKRKAAEGCQVAPASRRQRCILFKNKKY